MRLIKTWEEQGRTLVFGYDQQDYQIFNFHVYSDGIPGTRLSEYTSRHPKNIAIFSELMKIVPVNVLKDIILVDEVQHDRNQTL